MAMRLRRRGVLLGLLGGLAAGLGLPAARAQFFDPQRLLRGASRKARDAVESAAVETLARSLFPLDPAGSRFLQELPLLDGVDFGPFQPMSQLRRSADGGFLLTPGAWEVELQSYCLRYGTYERSGGAGYRAGQVSGKAASTIAALLNAAHGHPEVRQESIQRLIWSLLSGLALSQMGEADQRAARTLLTAQQVAVFDRLALEVPAVVSNQVQARLPAELRQLLAVRDRLRAAASRPGSSFRELEAIAVLSGAPPRHGQAIPAQRWSLHPDGYLLRFFSESYRRTRVQIVRAEPLRLERDGRGRPVRVAFDDGSALRLTYRDDLGPIRHRRYPELTAWCFHTITYQAPAAVAGVPRRHTVEGRGWTIVTEARLLSLLPQPGSGPLLAQAGRAGGAIVVDPNLDVLQGTRDDLRDAAIDQMVEASGSGVLRRFHEAHDRAESYRELIAPENPDPVNDLLDASQLRDGVVSVTIGDTSDRLDFISGVHARLARALARITDLFDRDLPSDSTTGAAGGSAGLPVFRPPSVTAAPGGAGQIRGLSARPF